MLEWWLGRMRRERAVPDILLAVAFVALDTVVTLVGGSWWPADPGPAAFALLGLQALACAALALRRRAPLTVVAILAGFTLALELIAGPLDVLTPANGGTVWAPFATMLAAYAPVRWCIDRRRAVVAISVLTIVVARPWEPDGLVIAVGLLRTAVGPLLALYLIARQELVRALTDRAERAEYEQELLAEQARVDERVRLAGEMHDVVTHRVSLMVLHAGALQMTAPDEATRRAAEELRAAGCQALDELRDLVGILRASHGAEDAPASSDVAGLVAQSVAAGVPVTLAETGEPGTASPVVTRIACRVVREALTNAVKHASGAAVTVHVSYRAGVHVSIRNAAPTGPPDRVLAATGSGLGLAALRQRVEVVHGTLRAGPLPDGGFHVDVTLPAFVPTTPPGTERTGQQVVAQA